MKRTKISETIGNIDSMYVNEAITYTPIAKSKKSFRKTWGKWVAMAACLCLLVTGGSILGALSDKDPNTNLNPLIISVYAQNDDGIIIVTP